MDFGYVLEEKLTELLMDKLWGMRETRSRDRSWVSALSTLMCAGATECNKEPWERKRLEVENGEFYFRHVKFEIFFNKLTEAPF